MTLAFITSFRRRELFLPTSNPLTKLLHLSSFPPSSYSIEQKCQNVKHLFQLQAHFITSGLFFLQHDPFQASRILKLSSELSLNNIHYTILIFRQIQSPDAFCINTVIKAYSSSSSDPNQAVLFYFEMLRNGFLPNTYTFPPLLTFCSKLQASAQGEKCHGHAIKNGVHSVVPVQNSLIHMYASFGRIDSAWRLFDKMSQRDLVSWNSIVHAFVKVGDLNNAHCLFDEMPVKNVVSWNIVMSGYLKVRNPGCVLKLFKEMVTTMGFRGISDTSIVNVLTACGRSARLKEGRSVHGTLLKKGWHHNSSLILNTALIDMYSKCQKVQVARIVFGRMLVEKNLVCWNVMVLGYCIHGPCQEGISLFTSMVVGTSRGQQVLVPDEITFIGVLCACARTGLVLEGRNYFSQMCDVYGIKPMFSNYWCMANLYYGAGLFQEAEKIVRSMPEYENGSSSESLLLSSLLGSCRFRGESDLGERIALLLIELEPKITSRYHLLLNVYAVAGRWEEVGRVKTFIKEKGMRGTTGCNLIDLNEVVHKFAIGDQSHSRMEEVENTMNELARELSLPPVKGPQPPMENKSYR